VFFDDRQLARNIHSIHLNGYKFAIVGTGVLNTTLLTKNAFMSLDLNRRIPRNLNQPPLKDTFLLPNRGYTIIRFLADKPGFWAFYSSAQIFFQTGTMAVLQVGNQANLPQKPNNWPTCGNFYHS
jgi:L-ascorbate oxidase